MGTHQERHQMSEKELKRVDVLSRLKRKEVSQKEASYLMRLSTRQVRRLVARYRSCGETSLIHGGVGKRSNRKISAELSAKILGLLQTRYVGFKPTFASEKLSEEHHIEVSREWLRRFMMSHELWRGRHRKGIRIHQQRERRACFGELIQMDGSPHDWFEGRAAKCCLIVLIDDATSRIVGLRFVDVEGTEAYFDALETYIKVYGCPRAVYTDQHSIFRVNIKEAQSGDGHTQLSRALKALDIELICANSPQAKGRVERANETLQDRLVKEMRLRGISSMKEANLFVGEYIKKHNKKFAEGPRSDVNAHREVKLALLEKALSYYNTRKLSKNLEISYNNCIYQIQHKTKGYRMRGAAITVLERHGKITLWYQGRELEYRVFDKGNRPAPIVTSKDIARPAIASRIKPSLQHPWRKYPRGFSKKALMENIHDDRPQRNNHLEERCYV